MSRDSLVLEAWRNYTGKLREIEQKSKRVPRLPDATGIYLSEATGCPRKASLRLLKYPAAPISKNRQVAMSSGIKGEEKIALVLEAMGWDIERQYPVQTRYGNGRIDVLAHLNADNSTHVDYHNTLIVEIKTSLLSRLKWLPQKDHTDQCLLYMGFMRAVFEDADSILGEVVYLLKESHDARNDSNEKIVAFPVEWDGERFDYLIGQLDLIDEHVRKRVPVPLELAGSVTPEKPPCAYPNAGQCQYWANCWGDSHFSDTHDLVEI